MNTRSFDYTAIFNARSKFSKKQLSVLSDAWESFHSIPGKRQNVMKFQETYPKVTSLLKEIKQKAGYQAYLDGKMIFVLANGKSQCTICHKQGFFSGSRSSRTDTFLCSNKCASQYALKVIETKNLQKHGVPNFFASKEFKKNRETYLENKYGKGITAPLLVPGAHESYARTCQENFGVDHALKSKQVRDKQLRTHKRKYGGQHYLASDLNRKRLKSTSFKRWGVSHPSQATEIKRKKHNKRQAMSQTELKAIQVKTMQTCLERYGVPRPSHVPEIQDAIQRNRSYSHTVTWRGKTLSCQGCEPLVLKRLETHSGVRDCDTAKVKVGSIQYRFKNKSHEYTPDIKVTHSSGKVTLIEAKNNKWLGVGHDIHMLRRNIAKYKAAHAACEARGWKFLMVLEHRKVLHLINDPHKSLATKVRRILKLK